MIKIVDNMKRSVLAEGRNNGMGFALLRKEGQAFHTVQPPSPCKDYLNEIVFTENTGIPSKGCGLVYPKKQGIFKGRLYMAIKIMPTSSGAYNYSRSLEQDQELLSSNHKNLETFMRKIEDLFGSRIKTSIKEANDGFFLVRGPLLWRKSTIGISLYSLLLRVGMTYDGKSDPIEFLQKYNYNGMDRSLLSGAMPRIQHLLKIRDIPKQPTFPREQAEKYQWSPHNLGIMSYKVSKDVQSLKLSNSGATE